MAKPGGQVTPKAVWALRRREFWRAKCHMRRMKKAKDALEVLRKNYPRNATYVYPGPGIAASNSGTIGTLFDGWEIRTQIQAFLCHRQMRKGAQALQESADYSNPRRNQGHQPRKG